MTSRTRAAAASSAPATTPAGSRLTSAVSAENVRRLFSPRSGLAPKAVLAAGISYLFLPIDLIPDRLPWVGHLDEMGFLLLGFAGGLLLSVPPATDARLRSPGLVARWTQRLAWRTMRLGVAGLLGRFALRLMLGRWPDAEELVAFCDGFDANAHGLPPLLRAVAYVPAARTLLNRAMLLSTQRGGASVSLGPAQMMGDPMALWRGPRVRFLHLEKTAGSSLIVALAAQFHPLQIHSDTDRRGRPPDQQRERHEAEAAHRRAAVVWGHYDLPALRRLDGDQPCFRFCLLREPRQRILSLYYFWRSNEQEQSRSVRFAHENRLLPFLRVQDPDIRNDIDNMYVRRLTGLYATGSADPVRDAPEAALAAALAALDGLDLVGISDRLGDSLSVLGRMLGFTPPARTPQVNVQLDAERNALLPVRPLAREPRTPEIDAELDRLASLDTVLYRHAEQRFQSLLEADAQGARSRPAAQASASPWVRTSRA